MPKKSVVYSQFTSYYFGFSDNIKLFVKLEDCSLGGRLVELIPPRQAV